MCIRDRPGRSEARARELSRLLRAPGDGDPRQDRRRGGAVPRRRGSGKDEAESQARRRERGVIVRLRVTSPIQLALLLLALSPPAIAGASASPPEARLQVELARVLRQVGNQ